MYTAIFAPKTMVMNTCASNCSVDCVAYTTPLGQCYQPALLFPNDVQWGDADTLDTYVNDHTVKRRFYQSKDGTCTNPTDEFMIPMHEKVGPIGDPRPCGEFYLNV